MHIFPRSDRKQPLKFNYFLHFHTELNKARFGHGFGSNGSMVQMALMVPWFRWFHGSFRWFHGSFRWFHGSFRWFHGSFRWFHGSFRWFHGCMVPMVLMVPWFRWFHSSFRWFHGSDPDLDPKMLDPKQDSAESFSMSFGWVVAVRFEWVGGAR